MRRPTTLVRRLLVGQLAPPGLPIDVCAETLERKVEVDHLFGGDLAHLLEPAPVGFGGLGPRCLEDGWIPGVFLHELLADPLATAAAEADVDEARTQDAQVEPRLDDFLVDYTVSTAAPDDCAVYLSIPPVAPASVTLPLVSTSARDPRSPPPQAGPMVE